jgi:hypothetical protein
VHDPDHATRIAPVAGIAGLGLELATGGSLVLGTAAFLISLAAFVVIDIHAIAAYCRNMVVRFRTPSAETA